jgi:ABC-type transport system substrate-binding protein
MRRISSLTNFGTVWIAPSVLFPAAATAADQIKIATWEDISTFDPGWMTSAERELIIMSSLYNGLVKYKEGSWDIVPDSG